MHTIMRRAAFLLAGAAVMTMTLLAAGSAGAATAAPGARDRPLSAVQHNLRFAYGLRA